MHPYPALYESAVHAAVGGTIDALFGQCDCDPYQLDCLLHPRRHPPVVLLGPCGCDGENGGCQTACFFGAISRDSEGNAVVSGKDCVGCGACIDACEAENLTDIKEVVPIFTMIQKEGLPVYALIAPATISQFSPGTTPGRLRSAFKALGFTGMIEVALFADILTLKEALEFDAAIMRDDDFMLTSCCCPLWVALIRRDYRRLIPHMPPSVSPMVASGRAVKKLFPGAKTVFIGPCIAKKAEARQEDVAEAVDYVLTFEETQAIFRAAHIEPETLKEDQRDHSSAAGRGYARTGGVSEAVRETLGRLRPKRRIPLGARQADGMRACKAMLEDLKSGAFGTNFWEGMGCEGGCVGGPKILTDRKTAAKNVADYAGRAASRAPMDNAYVLELLRRLGFTTIESLTKGRNMFTRDF